MVRRYGFAFDPRFRLPLAVLGIRSSTCEVVLTDALLDVRFGLLRLQTPRENLRSACVTGPHRALKAIGARASMVDGGVTFGTNAGRSVCITFHEPVGALLGRRIFRHPGLTVTVDDPDQLLADLALPSC